jgi:hypothetical protein
MFGLPWTLVFWLVSSAGFISSTQSGSYDSLKKCQEVGDQLQNNLIDHLKDIPRTRIVYTCVEHPNR